MCLHIFILIKIIPQQYLDLLISQFKIKPLNSCKKSNGNKKKYRGIFVLNADHKRLRLTCLELFRVEGWDKFASYRSS